jgi:peptide/nickel transport system substrate-binding protein
MKNKLSIPVMLFAMLALVISACSPQGGAQGTPGVMLTATPGTGAQAEATATQPAAMPTETTPSTAAITPTVEGTQAGDTTPTVDTTPTGGASTGTDYFPLEVRQAIAAAIDREALVDRVFEGRNIPAYSMVPSGYPFATEAFLDKYGTRNLELANQLLDKAGFTESNPYQLTIWYPPEHYGTTTADVMQVLKEQLEETGRIKVNLQSQNWAEYVDSFVAGRFPIFILGWFPDFVDPENWLTPFGSCTASPDQGIFFCNKDLDKLLLDAGSTTDESKREALYKQVGEFWAENVITIPLFWEPEFITNQIGIDGIAIGPPFEFNYFPLSFTADAKPASGKNDTIIIGTTDEVNSLDPQDAYATHDWEVLKNTNVPLMAYTPGTADLVPGAAESAPQVSDDGLTYTFTLRDNLKYADGTVVKAADYVGAWKRLNDLQGQVSGLVQAYVQDVQAPDERTVVYTLKAPFAFFPALAATPPFIPANPAIFKADAINQFPNTLDGIGPYRMVSHKPGEQLVLEANPNYFGEAPKIKNVIIRYFEDPTTMAQAVERGEIDIAWRTLGPVEAARLEGISTLKVTKIDAPSLRYLALNHSFKEGQ